MFSPPRFCRFHFIVLAVVTSVCPGIQAPRGLRHCFPAGVSTSTSTAAYTVVILLKRRSYQVTFVLKPFRSSPGCRNVPQGPPPASQLTASPSNRPAAAYRSQLSNQARSRAVLCLCSAFSFDPTAAVTKSTFAGGVYSTTALHAPTPAPPGGSGPGGTRPRQPGLGARCPLLRAAAARASSLPAPARGTCGRAPGPRPRAPGPRRLAAGRGPALAPTPAAAAAAKLGAACRKALTTGRARCRTTADNGRRRLS